MLHEAAHALATRRGIKDTSAAGNRYHNKWFVALAAELGLRGPDVPDKITAGRTAPCTGQTAYDGYADVAARIDAARLPFLIDLARPGPDPGGGDGGEDQGDDGPGKPAKRGGRRVPLSARASPSRAASSSRPSRSRTARSFAVFAAPRSNCPRTSGPAVRTPGRWAAVQAAVWPTLGTAIVNQASGLAHRAMADTQVRKGAVDRPSLRTHTRQPSHPALRW